MHVNITRLVDTKNIYINNGLVTYIFKKKPDINVPSLAIYNTRGYTYVPSLNGSFC